MRTALITTTINVPTVLALYRKHGPDVHFFIAGDRKTPSQATTVLDEGMTYLGEARQGDYACSELIGWNCIQRRNTALLEAVKWGADLIVSVDDDNIPTDAAYFNSFRWVLALPTGQVSIGPGGTGMIMQAFDGLLASSETGWFDVGQLLGPVASHRGFPHTQIAPPTFTHAIDAKVGVAAGICLGDPDISAVTRIARRPTVHGVSEVLRAGIAVDPNKTKTLFNTQNTAFIRELAPAMFCPPGLGRYDDLVASLVTQRVMRERGYHVHFGKPFVWQQRNDHDLIKDLKAEVWGMEHIEQLADIVNRPLVSENIRGKSVVDQVRWIYRDLADWVAFPKQASEAALAFCDDIEKIL